MHERERWEGDGGGGGGIFAPLKLSVLRVTTSSTHYIPPVLPCSCQLQEMTAFASKAFMTSFPLQ